MTPEIFFWIALLLIFSIGEGITVGLTSIWFALGALGALLVAAAGANQWVQGIVFILLSGLCLVLLRPVAKKMLNTKMVATNADRIIGAHAIVTEEIDNLKGTGLANVAGQIWTARSQDDTVISAGILVEICSIQGVKIIVKASSQDAK